jgi:hypothetical protein
MSHGGTRSLCQEKEVSLASLKAMRDGQMTLEVLIRAANNSWGLVFLDVLARCCMRVSI